MNTSPFKMIRPLVTARMEKTDHPTCVWIEAGQVGTLAKIALEAVMVLTHATILTSIVSPLADLLP